MIARPCNVSARCTPCAESSSPYENLSAEAPDPINYLAMAFRQSIPCENGGCEPDPCTVNCIPPNPNPVCPWCIIHGAGGGSGTTQEKAEQNANTTLQQQMSGDQGKPLFGNTAYGGGIPCEGGSTSNYNIPADTYYGETQEEADALAESNFNQLAYANLICITTSSLPGACSDSTDYEQTLAAYGGITEELGHYVWEISAGSLPPGFALDLASGLINGNPNTSVPGTYTFTVTVSDDLSNNASKDYTITILGIDQTSLPTGTDGPYGPGSGTAYSQQLTINSGADVATWALASGTLPNGITLGADGLISGTPESGSKGTYSFSVSATLGSQTCTQSLTLRIWEYVQTFMGQVLYGNSDVGILRTIVGTGLPEGRYELRLGTPAYDSGAYTSATGLDVLSPSPGSTNRWLFGTAPGFTMTLYLTGLSDLDVPAGDTGNGCTACNAACYDAARTAVWNNAILEFESPPAGIATAKVLGIWSGPICYNTDAPPVGEALGASSSIRYKIYKTGQP